MFESAERIWISREVYVPLAVAGSPSRHGVATFQPFGLRRAREFAVRGCRWPTKPSAAIWLGAQKEQYKYGQVVGYTQLLIGGVDSRRCRFPGLNLHVKRLGRTRLLE